MAQKKTTKTSLVVVESPAKARTLSRILGKGYVVMASMGHVRDLPSNELAVKVDDGFTPSYRVLDAKRKVVAELRKAAGDASLIYLATDPDREGEAISWHITQAAKIDPSAARRVVFHVITEQAIAQAFREPRAIDMKLVQSQQARRILDRLVGYLLSPLLWKKVRRGLSAGRVQSAALRLVVDREREVAAFVPQEYWTIDADLAPTERDGRDNPFSARFQGHHGARKKAEIKDRDHAESLVADLKPAAYIVQEVKERESPRRPAPPFITSTLQQEAWRKLRFSAKRTMALAQQLYEGISLGGEGPVGLITYMRTDSTHMAHEAVMEIRHFVSERYGPEYVPNAPRAYTRKVKGAQEAHEAIRPTSIRREPETLKARIGADQLALYQLVWQRALACQMADARFDQTTIDILAERTPSRERYDLRATGSVLRFPGYLTIYQEGQDDPAAEETEARLPHLEKEQSLELLGLRPLQHFTQPPPRYTEASLVKAMEERGIGRPSTYAPILSTLQDRSYILREQGRLRPSRLGMAVTDLLKAHFSEIVDLDFTSTMEEEMDEIARGEREWVPVLQDFYTPFARDLKRAETEMPRVRDIDEPTDEVCPTCGRPMVIKTGRFGRFLSCSGFPECRTSKPLVQKTGALCPRCGGDLVPRRSRKGGRTFYGCSNYPTCNFLVNERPLPQPCPTCGSLLVARGRDRAKCTACDFIGPRAEAEEREAAEVSV
ncbi:MAG: type I DNA topoisomerase [Chloroflexi bacterium]|nr:type I DNA topoisomerase [Chloroflexota bacterium]